jgi:hypothetical protein
LAYNFNNNAFAADPSNTSTTVDTPETPATAETPKAPGSVPATSDVPQSAAWVRFRSCRWQQPKDETSPAEFCTHREVKPYAGTTGFDPDAWCPDCQYYKLRRAPKKRSPNDDYSY